MFLSLTDDERQIVDATADALAAEAPLDRWFLPQTDPAAEERRLIAFGAEMGWTGLAAPAAIGGAGATMVDEMLIFRQIGARLGPVGLVAAALGAQVALGAGEVDLAAAIISGTTRMALASGGLLLGGGVADAALVVEGAWLRIVAIPDGMEPVSSFDWISTAVRFPVDTGPVLAQVRDAALAQRLRLLLAAQQQGVAVTAVAESCGYAKLREQFGRLIGSFQAVRHRIVDMELRARRAEAQLYFAAVALRDGREDAAFQIDAAVLLANDAARTNAEENVAVHGAIGVTVENSAHLLLKRAMLWAILNGSDEATLDSIAEAGRVLV
jgi:alkylation response protein AidB-like acyl-CoA dehydrogenase